MAWSTLQPNQWITYQDAQDSPFTKLNSIPLSYPNKFITKAEVTFYLDIIQSNLSGIGVSQYVPKQVLSSATVYSSAAYSESATRNNCGVESNPTSITLTSPLGQFTSTVNQSTADALAVNWVQANKQAYANSYGQCVLRATAWRGIYPYCIQTSTRPTGLTTKQLYNSYYNGSIWVDFYHVENADGSHDWFVSANYALFNHVQNGAQIGGYSVQGNSYSIGDIIYLGTGTDITYPPDGFYLFEHASLSDYVYHIVSGVIVEKLPQYY